jgi:hypothetical protein
MSLMPPHNFDIGSFGRRACFQARNNDIIELRATSLEIMYDAHFSIIRQRILILAAQRSSLSISISLSLSLSLYLSLHVAPFTTMTKSRCGTSPCSVGVPSCRDDVPSEKTAAMQPHAEREREREIERERERWQLRQTNGVSRQV